MKVKHKIECPLFPFFFGHTVQGMLAKSKNLSLTGDELNEAANLAFEMSEIVEAFYDDTSTSN